MSDLQMESKHIFITFLTAPAFKVDNPCQSHMEIWAGPITLVWLLGKSS